MTVRSNPHRFIFPWKLCPEPVTKTFPDGYYGKRIPFRAKKSMNSSRAKIYRLTVWLIAIVMMPIVGTAQMNSLRSPQAIICGKVTPDTLFRGVEVAPGHDSTFCVNVKNCGDTTVAFDAYTGLGDYTVSPSVSPALAPDSSFTFCITFRPKSIGDKHAFLFISVGALQYYIPMFCKHALCSSECCNCIIRPGESR